MRVIGFDPGLRCTGWGVIEAEGNRLRHVAHGTILSDAKADVAARLLALHDGITRVLAEFAPREAAIETTLANRNPSSTLKLGMARGTALLCAARRGLPITEYLPMRVKQAVVGTGHATKPQVAMMIGRLLPGAAVTSADAADALAVAVCHSHTMASTRRWPNAAADAVRLAEGRR